MKTSRLLLAALLALAPAVPIYAFDRILPSPRINDNGDVRLSNDVRIGRFLGGKFQSTPDSIEAGDTTVSDWNHYGPPRFQIGARGKQNTIVGIADNGAFPALACLPGDPNDICAFPTGMTGVGVLTSSGNQTFGLYGVARAKTTGTATAIEVTAINETSTPGDGNLPPNAAFNNGVVVPIAQTLGCGGTQTCSIAQRIVGDGALPNRFQNGIYIQPGAVIGNAITVDATDSLGPVNSAFLKNTGLPGAFNLVTKITGPTRLNGIVWQHQDKGGNPLFNLMHSGAIQSTAGATFGGVVKANGGLIIPFGTPATSTSDCQTGLVQADAGYLYICVATNTWKRSALTSW